MFDKRFRGHDKPIDETLFRAINVKPMVVLPEAEFHHHAQTCCRRRSHSSLGSIPCGLQVKKTLPDQKQLSVDRG